MKTSMHRCSQVAILLAVAGCIIAPVAAPAATYYVATNGVDTRTGLGDWTNALATISNAVAKAQTSADNVVLVSNGTYLTVAQIVITNAITVRSWNNGVVDRAGTVVQRSGPANHRIFYISNTAAAVEGFTIANGNALVTYYEGTGVALDRGGTIRNCLVAGNCNTGAYTYSGGGVWISQSGTADNCLITGNSGGWYAGGIHLRGGGLVTNCLVVSNMSNYASAGGGICVESGGVVVASTINGNIITAAAGAGGVLVGTNSVVRGCTINCNTALTTGGGVRVVPGGLVENCTIQSNFTTDTNPGGRSGAGLFFSQGGEARNCLISGNSGTNGGGVYFYGGGAVRNCLINGNIANGYAGGVCYSGLSNYFAAIQNCTVAGNLAAVYGGGMYTDTRTAGSSVRVENCIIYQNTVTAGTYSNVYNWSTNSCTYSNCCVGPTNNLIGANNISFSPLFVDAPGGDYRLQRASRCINAGLNQEWMATVMDLDGHARIDRYSGIVDMGCYEYVLPGTIFNLR